MDSQIGIWYSQLPIRLFGCTSKRRMEMGPNTSANSPSHALPCYGAICYQKLEEIQSAESDHVHPNLKATYAFTFWITSKPYDSLNLATEEHSFSAYLDFSKINELHLYNNGSLQEIQVSKMQTLQL